MEYSNEIDGRGPVPTWSRYPVFSSFRTKRWRDRSHDRAQGPQSQLHQRL